MTQDDIIKISESLQHWLGNKVLLGYLESVKTEYQLIKAYEGREIFELLQNIDDQYDVDKPDSTLATLRIVQVGNDAWLEVCNSGRPFTLETFTRLCQGSVSEKGSQFIGCKGIGFRSVLNLADTIEIYSGKGENQISVRFSKEYAQQKLDEISDSEHIQKQIEELRRKGYPTEYPILKAPEYIAPKPLGEFDTVIRLKLRDQKAKDTVLHDFVDFDRRVLIFLPHINRIKFDDSISEPWEMMRSSCDKDKITIHDSKGQSESFYTYHKDVSIHQAIEGSHKVNLTVAIPTSPVDIEMPLYSFFPVKGEQSPFTAILHATFCLSSNRNELDTSSEEKKSANKEIWEALLDFYVKKVSTLPSEFDRLKLLTPLNFQTSKKFKFEGTLGRLYLEAQYLDLCASHPILRNVNGQFICPNSHPVLMSEIPEEMLGETFSEVAKPLDSPYLDYARWLRGNTSIKEEEMLRRCINKESSNWSSAQRANVFKWWHRQGFRSLPRLIKDKGGDFIEDTEKTCFLTGGIKDLPEWAEISVISEEDEASLLAVYEAEIIKLKEITKESTESNNTDANKRLLARALRDSPLRVQEQSSRTAMISPVNQSVGTDLKRAEDFMLWLYKIWKEHKFGKTTLDVNFNLLTADDEVCQAKTLYFGEAYNNRLGASLFAVLGSKYHQVKKVEGIEDDLFLEDIGVQKMPAAEIKEVAYEKHFMPIEYQRYFMWLECNYGEHELQRRYKAKIRVISHLTELIEKAYYIDILRWLLTNDSLTNKNETDGCYVQHLRRSKWYEESFLSGSELPAFIWYQLSHTQWLKIGDSKAAPNQILVTDDEYPGVINVSKQWLGHVSASCGVKVKEIKQLLLKLGAKESVLELDSYTFYNIMLQLPEMDNQVTAKKLSSKIYREIIENSRRDSTEALTMFYADSAKRAEFMSHGRLLARNNADNAVFVPRQNVKFSSSAVIYTDDLYILATPPRSGDRELFQKVLGVTPYEQTYDVLPNPKIAESNEEFNSDYNDFLSCLMCYHGEIELETLLKYRPNITLVSYAQIRLNDGAIKSFKGEGYKLQLLKRSNRDWLIVIDERSRFKDIDKVAVAVLLEQIFNVAYNFPRKEFLGHIRHLYICDYKSRTAQIKADFEDLSELTYSRSRILNLYEIRQAICEKFNLDDEAKELINKIIWTNYNEFEEQKKVKELLSLTKININDLRDCIGLQISISSYNNAMLGRELDRAMITFREFLHGWHTVNEELQDTYCTVIHSLQRPTPTAEELGQPTFDAKLLASEWLKAELKKHGISENTPPTTDDTILRIYEENKSRVPEYMLTDFQNNMKWKSILHFKNTEAINKAIEECSRLLKHEDNEEEASVDSNLLQTFMDNCIVSDEATPGRCIEGGDIIHRGKTYSKREQSKRDKRAVTQGYLAEYLAVNKIIAGEIPQIQKYVGEEFKLKWVSGAASKSPHAIEGVDTRDCDDSLGYDIQLIGNDGRTLLIEVKSSMGSDCQFEMSVNEYNMASKYGTNSTNTTYRVIFVSDLNIDDSGQTTRVHFIDESVNSSFKRYSTGYLMVYQGED